MVHYRSPAIIYGRSTPVAPEVQQRATLAKCEVVQRRTGGGVVFAGPWMLGFNLLLPPSHEWSRGGHVMAFREFGSLWMRVLASLGVIYSMADSRYFHTRDIAVRHYGLQWSCFAGLSHGEGLDRHGRKLLGLAQARGTWGSLLSAGLILRPIPWETLEYLHHGQRKLRSNMHELASNGIEQIASSAQIEYELLQRLPKAIGG
ncbi:lipoyl protein ligase domain-containing protein [Pseudomonas yamanorum]|uniref:lipoyl protein ligase domain-containing protein n=1 Tax=Pseudomonas yamanorum TaxID=515393 RepID=UPI003527004E